MNLISPFWLHLCAYSDLNNWTQSSQSHKSLIQRNSRMRINYFPQSFRTQLSRKSTKERPKLLTTRVWWALWNYEIATETQWLPGRLRTLIICVLNSLLLVFIFKAEWGLFLGILRSKWRRLYCANLVSRVEVLLFFLDLNGWLFLLSPLFLSMWPLCKCDKLAKAEESTRARRMKVDGRESGQCRDSQIEL